jgi:hypothetical protein
MNLFTGFATDAIFGQSCESAKDKKQTHAALSQGVVWQYPVPGCRVAGKILI